jgi:UDP-glucose 4-epimerase
VRAVVTGASGFLGRELVRQARAAGLDVVPTGHRAQAPAPGYVAADIRDAAAVRRVVDGAEVVIHAAGLAHVFAPRQARPADYAAVNGEGTANVVGAAVEAGARHVVLVSSVAVYGPAPARGCAETAPCRPAGPYAESKWQAEQRARELTADGRTQLTVLRLATLYGEEDPGNVARLIRAIDRGRFLWVGDGQNLKSLIHREDAAAACLLALRRPRSPVEIYNVSDEPCSMASVVDAIARALGRRIPAVRVPALVARPLAAASSTLRKWLADDAFDGGRFRRALHFEPKIKVEEGLGREVMWYRAAMGQAG